MILMHWGFWVVGYTPVPRKAHGFISAVLPSLAKRLLLQELDELLFKVHLGSQESGSFLLKDAQDLH